MVKNAQKMTKNAKKQQKMPQKCRILAKSVNFYEKMSFFDKITMRSGI